MTMLKTLRTIERQPRHILYVCGLAILLGIPINTQIHAQQGAESRFLRYQPPAVGGPNGTGSGLVPKSGGLRPGANAGRVYSEGDVVYEGQEGMFPPGGPEMYGEEFNFSCPPTWVATAEIMFFRREVDSQSSLSSGFRLDEFGYDTGGRVTLSHRFDCLIGWELSYMGPFDWTQSGQAAGAGLNTILTPSGINLSAFNNAVFQQEVYTSRFQSVEASQKFWGWDVITTSMGLRYIDVEEDFRFNSVNALAETGTFSIDTNNRLLGGQIGLDLILPIGEISTTTRFRGSAYANFMDTNTLVTNAGAIQVNNIDKEIDFAALLEVGYYFSYRITPHIVARAGYEAMWLYGLALAPHQTSTTISRNSGNNTDRDGDVFYHSATGGIEVTW